ncbi:peroxiredoxin-2E-2, chloroplastic-like [Dendrobium catenatum]|uniref:glutaredoxin-dependent peroxiredoxin n=1 Tax=Dendrobium catenatum TaxID=906689 RepID=A0A2I0WEG8_9ASPA|nr:peroxiredoxin-2E-2, chloroplastic-like [Dendrobium catenatum]PKU74012.1 Peroxiredoxin-2E-2, chloroplastic [Dendrobium catenatum]
MSASVNNIAAAFSASRMVVPSAPAFSASPCHPASAAFSSTATSSGGLAISVSWNPHFTLQRSRCSSLLSSYGLPGPRPTSSLLRPPVPLQRRRGVIAVGDSLPYASLSYLEDNTVRTMSSVELSQGGKAVILGVPAAFTPRRWCPGKLTAEEFVGRAGEMKGRGAAVVACVSVNDVFVMRAWGESIGAFPLFDGRAGVKMLTDPDAGMARAMGLAADFTGGEEGFGLRSDNYCVVAADGIVKALFREDNGLGFDDVIKAI